MEQWIRGKGYPFVDIEFQALSDAGFRQEYFTREYRTGKPVENRPVLMVSLLLMSI